MWHPVRTAGEWPASAGLWFMIACAKDPVSWSEIPNNRVFTGCDDVRDAFLAGRLSADRAAVILGQGRQQGLSRSFKIRAPGDKQ